jgi:hypothetical protein
LPQTQTRRWLSLADWFVSGSAAVVATVEQTMLMQALAFHETVAWRRGWIMRLCRLHRRRGLSATLRRLQKSGQYVQVQSGPTQIPSLPLLSKPVPKDENPNGSPIISSIIEDAEKNSRQDEPL